jgi:acyl-CoA thioesterase FadM
VCNISVKNIGNTSITWFIEIFNQSETLCWSATQTTVCTNMDSIKDKIPVPEWIRNGLSKIFLE